MQSVVLSVPFMIVGACRRGYDLAYCYMFRNVKPSEEMSVT